MSIQSDLSYLRARVAAANAAADAAPDRGVRATHKLFASAYTRRIGAIIANDRTGLTADVMPIAARSHPAWTAKPLADNRIQGMPTTSARPHAGSKTPTGWSPADRRAS